MTTEFHQVICADCFSEFLECRACDWRDETHTHTSAKLQERIDAAVKKVLEPLEWKDKTRPFYNDNFEQGVKALADVLKGDA